MGEAGVSRLCCTLVFDSLWRSLESVAATMAFPPEFLDELRARTDLAGLIGRRAKLIKRGREFAALCPFHNEKTPSFTVSPDKGFYHCFGCGAHGDAVAFLMQSEGLSFPESVERLAGLAGLEVPKPTPEQAARAERGATLHEAMDAVSLWFTEQLQSDAGSGAREYLAGRGLDAATIAAFRLGFAPGRRGALKLAMNAKGFDDEVLIEAGLIKPSEEGQAPRDYFFDRIVFPITDRRGRVVACGGRTLGQSKAKYINSPETPLFHKGRMLYNLAGARRAAHDTGEVLVVEGYMDVIALAQAGFQAAVAPLGTAITEEQIGELWRLAPEPVLCLDGDAAGRRAGYRAAERALAHLRPGKSLRFALLPEGEDPDSLVQNRGAQALRQLLETALPLSALIWLMHTEGRSFETPERRAGLRQALRESVREIRDSDVRAGYETEMERRFDAAFGYRRAAAPGRRGPDRGSGRPKVQAIDQKAGRGVRVPRRQQYVRQEQALLAYLVNHPELLLEFAESVADLRLENRELDRLRGALVDLIAGDPALDSAGLRCHLELQGFAAVLNGLLSRDVYDLFHSARPGAPLDKAREVWLETLNRQKARRGPTNPDAEGGQTATTASAGARR
jgi:DNA primase